MLSQKNQQKNLDFLIDLAQKKGWQINYSQVNKVLKKEKPRFLYFPFTDSAGKEFFYKGCLIGGQSLGNNLRKEMAAQVWLARQGGPVRPVADFSQEGRVFWYIGPYYSGKNGIVCLDEDISLLTLAHMRALGVEIKKLWQIKQSQIPRNLFKELSSAPKNIKTFERLITKTRRYLITLRGAFGKTKLDWSEADEKAILGFFKSLKKEIVKFQNGRGVLVHGDLAPNNVFFKENKLVIFDWEWVCWTDNLLLALGIDVANFSTRAWLRPELGKELIAEVKKSPWAKEPFFPKSLTIGLVFSILQKIAPMFKFGICQTDYDRRHFNTLIKMLRAALV
ncbi:MAG: phosphotransferase [Candidatus Pacebacteria bacterium]|nr:phosphotransferase [Candidatus Paceibacterota bacterium]